MGLVYTALFLTVSVAVITHNSEAMMAAFRGESDAMAVDDIFTVRNPENQRLMVLANDVGANRVANTAIALKSQPACGKVVQSGGSFVYSDAVNCTSNQSFYYCINTGKTCSPAKVILRLTEMKPATDTIAEGPAVKVEDMSAQLTINSKDLEITNVRLGKTARVEQTEIATSGMKLAKVAADTTITFMRPAASVRSAAVTGRFDIETTGAFGRNDGETPMVEIAATTDTLADTTPAIAEAAVALPQLPSDLTLPGFAPVERKTLVSHLAGIDLSTPVNETHDIFDQSPFGTDCTAGLTASPLNDGIVALSISAPCHPNSRVEISHGKLKFAMLTGHTGNISVDVPALEQNALFLVTFADGTRLKAGVKVKGLDGLERVAVQWVGPYRMSLHAFEFGAGQNRRGHIWNGQASSPDQSLHFGGGYTVTLGDPMADHPVQAQIYTLPLIKNDKTGVVRFVVDVAGTGATCAQKGVVHSIHARNGRLVGASGLQFNMPDCDEPEQNIVLNNVARDLIIAGN